jgi:DNA polymerase III alpha subunit
LERFEIIGAKAAEKIISKRPYSSIEDFARKKACGYNMTKKLIHVGALDSLFQPGESLINKIAKYETAIKLIEFEEKLKAYDEKIAEFEKAGDQKSVDRTYNLKLKAHEKGPAEPFVDDFYASLKFKHKLDFLVKKSIFPTMNLDLVSVLKKDSKRKILSGNGKYDLIMDKYGKDVVLVSGEHLQQIDAVDVERDAKFCVPGYVMSTEVFTYQGGARKALKMIIDSSGYVSEKVLWPDYNTGELTYPETLKEGCIAYFVYTKKPGKPYTNIFEIIVEEESIKT